MIKHLALCMLLSTASGSIYARTPDIFDFFDLFDKHMSAFAREVEEQIEESSKKSLDNKKSVDVEEDESHIKLLVKNVEPKEMAVNYDAGYLQITLDDLLIGLKVCNGLLMIGLEETVKSNAKKDDGSFVHHSYHRVQRTIALKQALDLEQAQSKYSKTDKTFTLSIPHKAIKKIAIEVIEE